MITELVCLAVSLPACFFPMATPTPLPTPIPVVAKVPQAVNPLVQIINTYREQSGEFDLHEDYRLDASARLKACDMDKNSYFSHTDLQGNWSWHLFIAEGYRYVYAGENLARGYYTPASVAQAWMNSPKHKEIMLSSDYKDVGVASCGAYTVAHFGSLY